MCEEGTEKSLVKQNELRARQIITRALADALVGFVGAFICRTTGCSKATQENGAILFKSNFVLQSKYLN